MVKAVARHDVDSGNAARDVESLVRILGKRLSDDELSAWRLSGAATTSLIMAEKRGLLDPVAEELETWEACVTARQTSSAVFAALTAEGNSVECRIGDEVRSVSTTDPQYFTDAGAWLNAFWLAVVCQERGRLDMLSAVSVDALRASGAEFDEYIYAWVEALQAFWGERPELGEKLAEAIEGTDPDVAVIAGRELVLELLYPPIGAFFQFVQRDVEAFNEALAEGLELHRRYWTADEDRAADCDGFVALALLGVACLAYDAGMPVELDSEYLPKHLLLRSWVGEFAT